MTNSPTPAQWECLEALVDAQWGLDIDPVHNRREDNKFQALADLGMAERTETRSPFKVHYRATDKGREAIAKRRAKEAA